MFQSQVDCFEQATVIQTNGRGEIYNFKFTCRYNVKYKWNSSLYYVHSEKDKIKKEYVVDFIKFLKPHEKLFIGLFNYIFKV